MQGKTNTNKKLDFNVLLLLLVMVLMSFKIKEIGEGAVRPLYLIGLSVAITSSTWLALKKIACGLRLPRLVNVLSWCFIFILFYFVALLQGLRIGEREIKDALYLILSDMGLLGLLLMIAFQRSNPSYLASVTAYSFLLFGWIGGLSAFFMLAGGRFSMGSIHIAQSVSYSDRAHGIMGDPTHFGSLMGLCVVFLYYLYQRKEIKIWFAVSTLLMALIGMGFSGSRNAVLSTFLAVIVGVIINITSRGLMRGPELIKRMGIAVVVGLTSMLIMKRVAGTLDFSLFGAFRFGDPNQFSRLGIWKTIGIKYFGEDFHGLLIGGGFNHVEKWLGSPYNIWLRLLVDFGLIFTILFFIFVIFLLLVFVMMSVKDKGLGANLGVMLMGYWLVFSLFFDSAFSPFFHVVQFSLLVCVVLFVRLVTSGIAKVTGGCSDELG